MQIDPHRIIQSLFGAVLITFALIPLFGWEPPPVTSEAELMQEAILSSGYIIPVILIVYLEAGLSWLFGQFVALSAVLLFPISLNIVLFHSILNRAFQFGSRFVPIRSQSVYAFSKSSGV
jgi:hypothetical protein